MTNDIIYKVHILLGMAFHFWLARHRTLLKQKSWHLIVNAKGGICVFLYAESDRKQ